MDAFVGWLALLVVVGFILLFNGVFGDCRRLSR